MMSPRIERLIGQLQTTADKIRALHAEGFTRSEIYKALGIRYQHVRNVLVQDEARSARRSRPGTASRVDPLLARQTSTVQLGPDGRVLIPAGVRERLALKSSDTLLISVEDGEIRLQSVGNAIKRAQAIVRQYVPEGVSLVDELIADRRREAAREDTD